MEKEDEEVDLESPMKTPDTAGLPPPKNSPDVENSPDIQDKEKNLDERLKKFGGISEEMKLL